MHPSHHLSLNQFKLKPLNDSNELFFAYLQTHIEFLSKLKILLYSECKLKKDDVVIRKDADKMKVK